MAAAFIPTAGSTLEFRVFCQFNEQGSVNVRHLRVATVAGGGADLQTMADGLSASLAVHYKTLIYASASYRGLGIRQIFPLPVSAEVFSISGQGSGTPGGVGPLPSQVSGLISLRTNVGGRKGRGRIYLPFPSDSAMQNETSPNAAYLANLGSLGAFLIQTLNFGTAPIDTVTVPCLYNRLTHQMTDLVSYMTPAKWATQRRRGGFGRPNQSPI